MSEEQIEKEVTALIISRITFRAGECATMYVDAGILTVKVSRRFEDMWNEAYSIDDAYVFKRPVSAGWKWVEDKINFALKVLREAE